VIQVSATKSGEQIAKDIKRRFLDDFLAAWDESKTRAQAAEDAHNAKIKTYRNLCEVLGEPPKEPAFFHGSEFIIYRHDLEIGSVTIRVSSADSVRIDLSLDAENGLKAAKAIAELYGIPSAQPCPTGVAGP